MNISSVLSYLTDLSQNNNREWYHAHKAEYKAANAEFEALLQALMLRIGEFDLSILNHDPHTLTFKLNRDTRFSRDKSPYNPAFRAHISSMGKLPVPVGYYMMIYLASLMSVPKELYEAAEIDGANEFQKHMTVTIPHLMPTIALVSTISAISALKVFVEIYVMTKGGPLDSTKTIVYYIYERAFENLDIGLASAACVVLLIVVMIFSIINILCFERKKYGL